MYYLYFRRFAWSSNLTLLWTRLFLPYQAVDLPLGLPLGIKWKRSYRCNYWELITCQTLSESCGILIKSFPPVSRGVLYYPYWRGVLYHPFWRRGACIPGVLSKQMEGIIQDSFPLMSTSFPLARETTTWSQIQNSRPNPSAHPFECYLVLLQVAKAKVSTWAPAHFLCDCAWLKIFVV